MKNVNKLLTLGVGFALAYSANAAGTTAGTDIDNTATASFSVGGIAQDDVDSNLETFVVDRKVIFTVTTAGDTNVIPNATAKVLQFTVNHTGNYVADFALAGTNAASGDDFDASGISVFVEDGTNPGYQSGEDTETYIDELPANGSAIVYIVSNIPGTPVNTNVATMHLAATAAAGGGASSLGSTLSDDSGSADVAGTVQNVFADGAGSASGDVANDGVHSDSGDYNVVSANISVAKSSTVISDPVSGGTNPKRIPGAVIEYTIVVSNTGASTADSVAISDTLDANTTFSSIVSDDSADTPAAHSLGVVSAGWTSIAAAASKTLVFRVTVN
ncbi:MAG: hypothetical protein R3A80_10750 [Bdellovibrionota bacterium]